MSSLSYSIPVHYSSLLSYLKELPSNREWQRSSAASATQWLIKSLLVVLGAARFGHGILVNGAVLIAWGTAMFTVSCLIWRSKRQDNYAKCMSKSLSFGPAFFAINLGLVALLSGPMGMPIATAKAVLIPYGLVMNPVMFWLNDRVVFGHLGPRAVALKVSRAFRKTVAA